MRFTVAIPPMHRSSLEGRLGREVRRCLHWSEGLSADVVIGLPGEGRFATCHVWPGEEGAAAILEAGFRRAEDRRNLGRLHEIGRALASEQNLDKLLDMILTHACGLLAAEAGSLYLVVGEGGERELLFAHTRNARVSLPYHRFRMPISKVSMAGFVATTGECLSIDDVYQITPEAPYQFNESFDRQANYRSRSMLVVPLKDTEGEILGVLQLINHRDEHEEGQPVTPFPRELRSIAESLAGQAGVAVKNARLRDDIERLLEGFVNASVLAIEQRDPVTSGHSGRVAALTVGLAEAVNATVSGPFGELFFTDRQLREIRYASLLHDFGKVGVREQVLVKSKKLDPGRLELLLQRLRQRREEQVLEALRKDWEAGQAFDARRWRQILEDLDGEAGRLASLVLQSNEPTVLPEAVAQGLEALGELRCTHWDGQPCDVVSSEDLLCLGIRRGSLSDSERLEIESHVSHTYHFLRQIPWTKDLSSVPDIAYAHHERMNGLGYPRKVKAPEIPIQSRAMAIADVFDALTAQDRPYKAAVPLEKSLAILEDDAQRGHFDPELLKLFIEARVFELSAPRP